MLTRQQRKPRRGAHPNCPTPNKVAHPNQTQAIYAALRMSRVYTTGFRAYQCACKRWHLTTQQKRETAA